MVLPHNAMNKAKGILFFEQFNHHVLGYTYLYYADMSCTVSYNCRFSLKSEGMPRRPSIGLVNDYKHNLLALRNQLFYGAEVNTNKQRE